MGGTVLMVATVVQACAVVQAVRLAWRLRRLGWLFLALANSLLLAREIYSSVVVLAHRKPADVVTASIALLISLLMAVGLTLLLQWLKPDLSEDGSPETIQIATQVRLKRQAVLLGLLSSLGCAGLAYFACAASRDAVTHRLLKGSLDLAHMLETATRSPPDRPAALLEMERLWRAAPSQYADNYLRVIDANGRVQLDSRQPESTGPPAIPAGAEELRTVQALTGAHRDWVGRNQAADGSFQIAAYAYSAKLDGLVAVVLPARSVDAEIRAAALPWCAGLAGIFAVIFPLTFGLLYYVVSASQRSAFRALRRMLESERRYRSERQFSDAVIDGLPGVFYLVDPERHLRRWNKNLEAVTGYSAAELASIDAAELFPTESRPGVQQSFRQVIESGSAVVEALLQPRAGVAVPYFFTGLRVVVEGTPCMAGVGIDVSERRQATALIDGQKEVIEMIAMGAPLADSLDALLRLIEAQSAELVCSILLLDADGIHLRHGAGPSLPEEFIRCVDGQKIGPHEGACGAAAFGGEPVIAEDIALDPRCVRYRPLAAAHGVRACWSTPIFDARKKVIGTFAIYSRRPGPPAEEHRRLVGIATHIAAIAITRQREDAALRQSEEQLRLALDAAHMGTFDWDMEHNRVTWSPWHEELWGFAPGEFDGTFRAFSERVHPDDLAGINDEIARCMAAHEYYAREFRVVWPDGSLHWVVGTGEFEFAADGTPARMRGAVVEITARRRAEEELRASEKRLAAAQARAQLGSWELDLTTMAGAWSAEMSRLHGRDPSTSPPTFAEFLETVHPEDRALVSAAQGRLAHATRPVYLQYRVRPTPGSVRYLSTTIEVERDEAGRAIRAVGTTLDVTESKRAEEELRRLSHRLLRAEDKERRRIAREMHDSTAQDLVAAMMTLQMLQDSLGPGDEEVRTMIGDTLALIENSANDIRTLSYVVHPPRLEESGLAAALTEYAAGFSRRADIRVRVDVPPDLLRLPEDLELALFRVVQESLANVLRHSHSDTATVRLAQKNGQLELEVVDQGHGFSVAGANVDPGALGVGIASMRERIEHFGGSLEVESSDRGTIVSAILPLGENAG